jgi:predicted dehydrogenase
LIERYPDVELAFLRQDKREDELSNQVGATIVADIHQGLKWSPDFVIVASPSATHSDYIEHILAGNYPVYVEKPVVISNEQVDLVKRYSNSYSAPSLVGCNMRYLDSIKQIKQILHRGELGNIVRANLVVGQWLPDWRPNTDYRASYSADSEMGGGVLFDLIHEIDMAQWLFGPFDFVLARTGKYSSLEIRSEDTAAILLDNVKTGVMVTISMDYVSRNMVRRYEIVGENGTLIWDLGGKQLRVESNDEIKIITESPEDFDIDGTYIEALDEIAKSVKNGVTTSHDIFEGVRTVELLLKAKVSGMKR